MKTFIFICFLAVVAVTIARPNMEHYTDKYDKVDIGEILGNKRLLLPYIKCILDQGKCAPEAKELKEHIKDALENECGKCTEPQKEGTRRVIGHLINHEPEYWTELTAKYDPEHKFTAKYEKELKEIKGQ